MKFRGLIKSNFKDILAGSLVKLSILLSQLLLVPIFLNTLGTNLYGEWLILTTIPNYLILSDLGLTVTATNVMCRQIVLGDFSGAKNLFRSTNTLILLIVSGIFFAVALICYFYNVSNLLSLKIITEQEAENIILAFIINILFSLLLSFNLGYFKAINNYSTNQLFVSGQYFLDFIITIIILVFKLDILFIPLLLTLNRFLILIISYIKLSENHFYSYGFSKSIGTAKTIIPSSLNYTIYNLGFAFLLQGNTFIVGKLLGSQEVVIFTCIRTITNSIKSVMSVIYLPTLPKYTILITKKEYLSAYEKYKKTLTLVIIIASATSWIIYMNIELITTLWLHKTLNFENIFIITMLVSGVLQTVWNAGTMVPLSINRTRELIMFPLLSIVNLLIQYNFLVQFGLKSASISLLLLDLVMIVTVHRASKKILKPEYQLQIH